VGRVVYLFSSEKCMRRGRLAFRKPAEFLGEEQGRAEE
jgi:hypothetical protein